jgi:flagellar hook protein FlgE
MLRSLSASISGLQNHQTRMDVIGNNIANVNTTGYKAGRVTFEESFSQLLQGSSRPPGDGGGTNPLQVGLGMSLGSVDTMMQQGNLEATGQLLDLAIEGNAYFPVSDGDGTFFTRAGAFQLDSQGQVVLPNNGFVLQGRMADEYGNIASGTPISNLSIPFSEEAPARATTEVEFSRNLDADAIARGSVVYSQRFLHTASDGTAGADDDLLIGLHDSKGENLGISEDDVLTITVIDSNGDMFDSVTSSFVNPAAATPPTFTIGQDPGEYWNLSQMLTAIENTLGGGAAVAMNANGGVDITPGVNIATMQITSDNPLSNALVNRAFNVSSNVAAGSTESTETLLYPAEATDLLSELVDANGDSLGLEVGDEITISGTVGGESVASATPLTYTNATTMNDLLIQVRDDFQLPYYDSTPQQNLSVSMNAVGTDDELPDGTMVIRGQAGASFAIDKLSIMATNSDNDDTIPSLFNANTSMTEYQEAQDNGVEEASMTIYDESGQSHELTMQFVHTDVPSVWNWQVNIVGDAEILSGGSGTITFGQDGTVSSFIYDDGSPQMTVEPMNGSAVMRVDLDVGAPGDFSGLTQFAAPSTVSAIRQDGYASGSLNDISIDEFGMISGAYTNGVTRDIGQIALVDFVNPGGLQKVADSVYTMSANSGDPIFGMPGEQSSSTLRPGALEMSNVDLASEFTSMITTQRGYQANSRVITVSDSMLEELMSLKR